MYEPIGQVLTGVEFDGLPENPCRELVDALKNQMAAVCPPDLQVVREIEPVIELHTFRLGDTGYIESGVFTAGDTVAAPGLVWATVDVSALED